MISYNSRELQILMEQTVHIVLLISIWTKRHFASTHWVITQEEPDFMAINIKGFSFKNTLYFWELNIPKMSIKLTMEQRDW